MTAKLVHDGNASYLGRAQHLAVREVERWGAAGPTIPASWLSYYLSYRAGLSIEEIAEVVEVDRRHIAKRLLACMGIFHLEPVRDRIGALVEEMGRARFDEREAEIIPFPVSRRLTPQYPLEVVS